MVFQWSLSDSKSPQVSRTLLSILAVLTNAVVLFTPLEFFTSVLADGFSLEFEWQQVSSSLQDSSQDSRRSNNTLVIVPKAPIIIIIICLFLIHLQNLSEYISLVSINMGRGHLVKVIKRNNEGEQL